MRKSELQEEENNMEIFAIIDTNVIVSALISDPSTSLRMIR